MVLTLLCACIPMQSAAQETQAVSVDYEYLDDGSYFVTVVEELPSLTRAINSRSGSSTTTYVNGSGVAQFSVKVTATFTYNGATAKATSVSGNSTMYVTGCTQISSSKSSSANYVMNAYASATAKVNCKGTNVTRTATLYCSGSGVLS